MSSPNAWQSARRVRQKSGCEVHGLATVAAHEKRMIQTQPCAVDSVRAHCQRPMDEDQEMRIHSRGAHGRGAHAQTLASTAPCVVLHVCSASSHTRTVEGRVCWRPCEAGSLSPISLVRFRQGRVLSRFEGGHFWGSREEKAKRTRHDDSSGYGRRYRFSISYRARSVYGPLWGHSSSPIPARPSAHQKSAITYSRGPLDLSSRAWKHPQLYLDSCMRVHASLRIVFML